MSSQQKNKPNGTNITRVSAGASKSDMKRAKINLAIIGGAVVLFIFIMIFNSISNHNNTNENTTPIDTISQEGENDSSKDRPIDLIAKELADKAKKERFSDSDLCSATYEADGSRYLNERGIARGTTTTFIESGKLVFEDKNCGTYMLAIDAIGEDDRGNNSTFRFATFVADRDDFLSYNWSKLKGTSVGRQLDKDGILKLPLNTRMSVEDFRYN